MRLLLPLVLLLGSALAADSGTTVPSKRPPDPELAQALWSQSCSACHGAKGLGDGPIAAALGGVESLKGRITRDSLDEMTSVVRNGNRKMPAFSETIDAGDTKRILEWIRDVSSGKIDPKPGKPGKPDAKAAEPKDPEPKAEGNDEP